MDDDFCPDIIAILIPFGQNGSDCLFADIIFGDKPSIVCDDNGFALVCLEAFGLKHLFRKSEFTTDGSILIRVLKNTDARKHRMVNKVSLFREVGGINGKAIKPEDSG